VDIQQKQNQLENLMVAKQDSIEQEALKLPQKQRIPFLTNYSAQTGEWVHQQWLDLGDFIITKYNDGYIKDENNRIQTKGYSEAWLRFVRDQDPDKHLIKGTTKEL
jgi:hypothetical protein